MDNHPAAEILRSVPLIANPSLASVPKQISLPRDIHPLPTDVAPYFVYPFTLEEHALSTLVPQRSRIVDLAQRHNDVLAAHAAHKHARQQDQMRRVAPGWSGQVLEPDKNTKNDELL